VKVADFDYDLPPERIAQRPAAERDGSRLLVLPATGAVEHDRFERLAQRLASGDLVVLNDTRVRPARLVGRKPGGGRVELLLIEQVGAERGRESWRCLLRSSRPPAAGGRLAFGEALAGEVVEREGETWIVRLAAAEGSVEEALGRAGQVPLPPYVRRGASGPDALDRERYQTVYARHVGAVAAPTAGLHFTAAAFERLARAGIECAMLTLHVGPGTFLPVRGEQVGEHRLHAEPFELPAETAAAVERARRRGGRVVAVGTTVVRALEASAAAGGQVLAGRGRTDLFIRPGFRFGVVDLLLTNFHLPRSTLLMLVAAFAGTERVLAAYREALRSSYRFYSYGDAMLVEGERRG
jgi:S-adenosylmethionine:tRNA ribosyltransferase-isomerase